jgi:hypothetical protein
MTDEAQIRKYIRAKGKLESKLNDIDRKLDHVLFRLRKENARVYSDEDQPGEKGPA